MVSLQALHEEIVFALRASLKEIVLAVRGVRENMGEWAGGSIQALREVIACLPARSMLCALPLD